MEQKREDVINKGILHIEKLIGSSLSNEGRELLLSEPKDLPEDKKKLVIDLIQQLYVGFFNVAREGYEFCPIEKIKATYGKSIEENYPGGSDVFMKFAKSYWTFKELASELSAYAQGTLISQIYNRIEVELGSRFFPMPGIKIMPSFLRKVDMKNALKMYNWPSNLIDEFIRNNPILKR